MLLPAVRPNIGTGAALGMGRIAGDTAIVGILLGATLQLAQEGDIPLLNQLRGTGSTLTSYVYDNSPAGEGNAPGKAYAPRSCRSLWRATRPRCHLLLAMRGDADGDEGGLTGDANRRTHLANERTQLAWWRTGLTSVAVGVGIGRVVPALGDRSDHWAYAPIGVGYILYGILFVLAGTWRQRAVERAVMDARWHAQDRTMVLVLTAIAVVLALATALLVVIDS